MTLPPDRSAGTCPGGGVRGAGRHSHRRLRRHRHAPPPGRDVHDAARCGQRGNPAVRRARSAAGDGLLHRGSPAPGATPAPSPPGSLPGLRSHRQADQRTGSHPNHRAMAAVHTPDPPRRFPRGPRTADAATHPDRRRTEPVHHHTWPAPPPRTCGSPRPWPTSPPSASCTNALTAAARTSPSNSRPH
jgi:hypothetical protein